MIGFTLQLSEVFSMNDYLNMSLKDIEFAENTLREMLDDRLRNMKYDEKLEEIYVELEKINKEKKRRKEQNG